MASESYEAEEEVFAMKEDIYIEIRTMRRPF
jgi:hypothetical protein